MTLVEEMHAARKARLLRMGGIKPAPVVPVPVVPEPIEFNLNPKPIWFSVEESPPPPDLPLKEVVEAVCRYFELSGIDIKGHRRTANIVYPRQIAMCLARRYTTKSFPQIGRVLGDRDHTTALHGARKIDDLCRRDWRVAYDVAHIEATL